MATIQESDTYVDLLPLADVADEAREAEEADEREQLGQPQDAQRPTRVQDLEALRVLLQKRTIILYQSLAIYFGDDIKKFSVSWTPSLPIALSAHSLHLPSLNPQCHNTVDCHTSRLAGLSVPLLHSPIIPNPKTHEMKGSISHLEKGSETDGRID